jgi:hypothetical protein
LLGHRGHCAAGFGKKHNACGGPVEAVNGVERVFAISLYDGLKRGVARFVGLHREAGRFGASDELVVFVEDVEHGVIIRKKSLNFFVVNVFSIVGVALFGLKALIGWRRRCLWRLLRRNEKWAQGLIKPHDCEQCEEPF